MIIRFILQVRKIFSISTSLFGKTQNMETHLTEYGRGGHLQNIWYIDSKEAQEAHENCQ